MRNLEFLLKNAFIKEAEELKLQVMQTRKRVFGEEHPKTLTSMGNLAITYKNQRQWKEAEELGIQVLKVRQRVLGEEHCPVWEILLQYIRHKSNGRRQRS